MGLMSKILLGFNFFSSNKENKELKQNDSNSISFKELESDFRVLSELYAKYLEVSKNYQRFFKEIEEIKETYIAEIILDQITYDVLTPDVSSDNIIEISPNRDDEELKEVLKEFEEIHNIDQLVLDITSDLVAFGSYTLRPIVREGEGIVEIVDDVRPGEVIPFYKNQEIQFHLKIDEKGKLSIHEPTEYVTFFVNARRLRLELDKRYLSYIEKEKREKLPAFVKIGSPLFTIGVIKKIKELNLLEKLVPASKIHYLSKGNIVGVYVPPSLDPKEAFEYAKKIERKINSLGVAINKDLDQLSIVEILKGAGRIKVIPITNEKGQLTRLEYKPDEPSDLLNSIQDLREIILTSVGIPPELIFNTGNNTKGEILKRYSRYLRRLKYIQKAIINGIRELILIHLINKGLSVTPSDFTVRFANSLVNVDDLDKLEFQQATTQILSDVKRFVDELSEDEKMQEYVNVEGFAEYLNTELSKVGLDSLIHLPGEE